jgi:predicted RNase H-like HicB family nuclease
VAKGTPMTREYLVVYEKGKKNWGAFSPDIPGCGTLGDTLEETRAHLVAAVNLHLEETVKAGEPIPEATTTVVDFKEFDPDHEIKQYLVEWLEVTLPASRKAHELAAAS